MAVRVRAAVAEDAEAIAACNRRCWQESYRHAFSSDHLDALDHGASGAGWRRALDDGQVLAAAVAVPHPQREGEDAVLGFAVVGTSRDDPAPEGVELWALYLRRAHQGGGLARQLLDAVVGDAACSLWVLEDNPRAHAFYRREGFTPDGARQLFPVESVPVVRLLRPARPRSQGHEPAV